MLGRIGPDAGPGCDIDGAPAIIAMKRSYARHPAAPDFPNGPITCKIGGVVQTDDPRTTTVESAVTTQTSTWQGDPRPSLDAARASRHHRSAAATSCASPIGNGGMGTVWQADRHRPAPRRRGQGGAAARRAWPASDRSRDVRADAARGPRRRRPVAPARRAGLRRGHRGRPAVDRDGAAAGAQPRRDDHRGRPARRPRGRQDRHRAARRARGRPRRRRAAPRRQAGQRADLHRRPVRADRLRRGPDAVREQPDHARHGARLAALHLAGAGGRRAPSGRPATCSRSASRCTPRSRAGRRSTRATRSRRCARSSRSRRCRRYAPVRWLRS